MELKDILSLILQLITTLAIVIAVFQIQISRKQLNLSVIEMCINNFRNLDLLTADKVDSNKARRYIDLVNEELFYIQKKYLPRDVVEEWIDGMIDYIAIINSSGIIQNPQNCIPLFNQSNMSCLNNSQRIKRAITLKCEYNWRIVYSVKVEDSEERNRERKLIVNEILQNLKS
jgi:hypothetical protein